eukprot:6205184-Pleurochrysis_carterae.AAC.1
MQAHFDNDLSENTLAGFNSFYHDYNRCKRSLPAHQRLSEGVMSKQLSHVDRLNHHASASLPPSRAAARARIDSRRGGKASDAAGVPSVRAARARSVAERVFVRSERI